MTETWAMLDPRAWPAEFWWKVLSALGGAGAMVVTWYLRRRASRREAVRPDPISARFADADAVATAVRWFVPPNVVNPFATLTGRSIRLSYSLMTEMDAFINGGHRDKFLFLLGDSGAGKTTALLAYAARFRMSPRNGIVPPVYVHCRLGKDALDHAIRELAAGKYPGETNLFVDGLDEHPDVEKGVTEIVHSIIDLTVIFRRVILSCRSQYLPTTIFAELSTVVPALGPQPLGATARHGVRVRQLAPLPMHLVFRYLWKRFPWRFVTITRLARWHGQLQDLAARPMVLAFLCELYDHRLAGTDRDDLTGLLGRPVELFDVYLRIIDAWLVREQMWIPRNRLWGFTQALIEQILRQKRDGTTETLSAERVDTIATKTNIDIHPLRARGRSLLSLDSAGNIHFTHRSVLEFCIVALHFAGRLSDPFDWTDMMKQLVLSAATNNTDVVRMSGLLGEERFRDQAIAVIGSLDRLKVSDIDLTSAKISEAVFSGLSNRVVVGLRLDAARIGCNQSTLVHGCGVTLRRASFRHAVIGGETSGPGKGSSQSILTIRDITLESPILERTGLKRTEFFDCCFESLRIHSDSLAEVENVEFTDCVFRNCDVPPAIVSQFRFVGCEFLNSWVGQESAKEINFKNCSFINDPSIKKPSR